MTSLDKSERIGTARIQHGKLGDRVYLMDAGEEDAGELLDLVVELALVRKYSKVFAKLPARCREVAEARGFVCEATVPGYFAGSEDALFYCRYLDEARARVDDAERLDAVLAAAKERNASDPAPEDPAGITFRAATPEDAEALAGLYATVFESYPFPIDDPAFIRQGMAGGVEFEGAWDEAGRLVAAASAEVDSHHRNAEMTDFATLPDQRGKGMAYHLLRRLERRMPECGVVTVYTIARAVSAGMNITFARLGYVYTGRLINNTPICGRLESMNVWGKRVESGSGEGGPGTGDRGTVLAV